MTRIIVTGGGTGGHLYPALAVVEGLQKDSSIESILYIGNKAKKEADIIPQLGIRFVGLTFSGMPRGKNLSIVPWFFQLLSAASHARRIMQEFKPHVVFGTGGYITAPVLLAALSLKIPYVVHEPDAHPGLVNRVMGRWAARMTCAFDDARQRLKTSHLTVTGNPLRSDIGQIAREVALKNLNLPFTLEKPILLITGGSQGARTLNNAVLDALPQLISELNLQVMHQTGEKLYEEVKGQCPESYQNHPAYWVQPFITDMASTLALANMAVCRSGSMTLSEMYRGHIPTILVPYPYAAADHQRQNALASQRSGASVMIEDAEFTEERLVSTLRELLVDQSHLEAMKQAAASLSAPQATEEVIQRIQSVALADLS